MNTWLGIYLNNYRKMAGTNSDIAKKVPMPQRQKESIIRKIKNFLKSVSKE